MLLCASIKFLLVYRTTFRVWRESAHIISDLGNKVRFYLLNTHELSIELVEGNSKAKKPNGGLVPDFFGKMCSRRYTKDHTFWIPN